MLRHRFTIKNPPLEGQGSNPGPGQQKDSFRTSKNGIPDSYKAYLRLTPGLKVGGRVSKRAIKNNSTREQSTKKDGLPIFVVGKGY